MAAVGCCPRGAAGNGQTFWRTSFRGSTLCASRIATTALVALLCAGDEANQCVYFGIAQLVGVGRHSADTLLECGPNSLRIWP